MKERLRQGLGRRLRKLRKKADFTQQKVADSVGVELTSYQRWEYGKSLPTEEHLEDLIDFFDTSYEYLVTGQDKDHPLGPIYDSGGPSDPLSALMERVEFLEQRVDEYDNKETLLRLVSDLDEEDLRAWSRAPRAIKLAIKEILKAGAPNPQTSSG